jgi:hypothetical protein
MQNYLYTLDSTLLVGGEAEGFFEFYAGHVLPWLREG